MVLQKRTYLLYVANLFSTYSLAFLLKYMGVTMYLGYPGDIDTMT